MKKIFVYIIGFSLLTTTLYNCKKEQSLPYYRGVNFYITKKHSYPLNSGVKGDISISDKNINKVNVYANDQKIVDLSLTKGKGNYDIPKADVGLNQIGDETNVRFSADVDGNLASKYYVFKMKNPLTIDGPDFVPPADKILYVKYKLADDCDDPDALNITHAVNSGDYTTVSGDFDLRKDSVRVVINPSMASDTLKYKFHFENTNCQFDVEHQIVVQIERAWDFEKYDSWTTDFAPWTLEDRDGLPTYGISAFDYPGEQEVGSWRIFDYADASTNGASDNWAAHSGDKYAFCMAAQPGTPDHNDDWMISGNFDIEAGYELDMFAKSVTDQYGLERLIVKVVDNDTNEETVLTNDPYTEVPKDWTNYNWPLDDWAGKNIHVEIGCVSHDAFALFVDDFQIKTPNSKTPIYYNNFENTTKTFKAHKVK